MSASPNPQLPFFRSANHVARWQRRLLGLILVCAAILRFYHIDGSSLWSDEGNTWALLGRSFGQIARDAAADIHPPGYYWLLKVWSIPFGTSAFAMRSFSALLGVLLVYLLYRIGCRLHPRTFGTGIMWPALLAAFLAAVNPFQIYYSQEARMYLLLALAGTGLMLALLTYLDRQANGANGWAALLGYVIAGVIGLWTHYSFPILLVAAGLGYLMVWGQLRSQNGGWRCLLRFGLANGMMLLLYMPWLPTAIKRVLAWPAGGEAIGFFDGIQLTLATLLVGPRQGIPAPQLLWLALTLLLPLLGFMGLRRHHPGTYVIFLWWALPIGLMFGLGLFNDAFLKFLLTASPAWLLLLAMAPWYLPWPRLGAGVVLLGGVALAVTTLSSYYHDPTVRDNYADVAAYLSAVADPQQDLVILDAPGQQEVWQYYDPGVPVLALPQQRPANVEETIATLAAASTGRRNLYALFWATDEADPDRIVESWLDQHGFKGLERWQGNLRFVIYTLAETLRCEPPTATGEVIFGEQIHLRALCRVPGQQYLRAGEALLFGLEWQALATVAERYKVSVQLLNEHNHVVAQRDSEPVGNSRPTNGWQPGETIVDQYGIPLPIGLPPGEYRMIVALYDAESGTRVSVVGAGIPAGGDSLMVGSVQVALPEKPLPAALVPVQHSVNRMLGPLRLVGYSAYRQGFAHAPQTPLTIGESVEFTFIWQAPEPLPPTWPAALTATLTLGNEVITFAPAGEQYPTALWRAGQLLQYSVSLPYDGTTTRPQLQIADETMALYALPVP